MPPNDLYFSSFDSPADMSRKIKLLQDAVTELRDSFFDLSIRLQVLGRVDCMDKGKSEEMPWMVHSKMEKPADD